jgi:hypothetical protein
MSLILLDFYPLREITHKITYDRGHASRRVGKTPGNIVFSGSSNGFIAKSLHMLAFSTGHFAKLVAEGQESSVSLSAFDP